MATLSRRLRMFRSAPEKIRAACEGMDQTRTLWPFNFGSQNVSGRGPHQIIAIECNWRLFFVHVESIATGRSLVRFSPYKVKAKPATDRFEYVRVMSGYAKQSLWGIFCLQKTLTPRRIQSGGHQWRCDGLQWGVDRAPLAPRAPLGWEDNLRAS